MERREKARAEREWDRDKIREFGKPGEEKEGGPRRSRSRERRRKERGKSKEKKTEKKGKGGGHDSRLFSHRSDGRVDDNECTVSRWGGSNVVCFWQRKWLKIPPQRCSMTCSAKLKRRLASTGFH